MKDLLILWGAKSVDLGSHVRWHTDSVVLLSMALLEAISGCRPGSRGSAVDRSTFFVTKKGTLGIPVENRS